VKQLSEQVGTYRETIPRFDELVQQRREAFQAADSILDEPLPIRRGTPQVETPQRQTGDGISRSASPSRPSAFEGFAQRLFSELGTPSRSGSPRGRKEQSRSSGAASPMLSPGSAPPLPKALPFSLRDASSPHSDMNRSHSPSRTRGEVARPSERDYIADSQAAAFAAIDQRILARRIGPSTDKKIEPVPLRVDTASVAEPETAPTEEAPTAEQEPQATSEQATTENGAAAVDGEAADDNKATDQTTPTTPTEPTASVSHIITNVIVLQSFLLELTSLMQVRAGLFEEIRFV
jgi:hypothetical protein